MIIEFIKRLNKLANRLWLFFLDLIFPIECLGCSGEGTWLCEDCFKKINLKPKQYCLYCKQGNDFGRFCPSDQTLYALDGVWIAALYDELLISRAIKKMKYYFLSGLADSLGRLIIIFVDKLLQSARVLKSGLNSGVDWRDFKRAADLPLVILNFKDNLVIPVPLSRKRRRWRGFNQAELLARRVAENYGLELDNENLIRVKHKKAQAKLNEMKRLENIKNCFVWRGGNLNKKNIILVDDVVTTGATLNECAKILKANGAGEVFGLVVAKG